MDELDIYGDLGNFDAQVQLEKVSRFEFFLPEFYLQTSLSGLR